MARGFDVNLHFVAGLQHKPTRVILAGLAATHLIGPCFVDGPVNAISYEEMQQYTAEHLFQNSA